MTLTNLKFHHGEEVVVSDKHGNYLCRGKIVGCYACQVSLYDVQPMRTESLAKRLHVIPEHQLRRVSRAIKAYERQPERGPVHIRDEV